MHVSTADAHLHLNAHQNPSELARCVFNDATGMLPVDMHSL